MFHNDSHMFLTGGVGTLAIGSERLESGLVGPGMAGGGCVLCLALEGLMVAFILCIVPHQYLQ